MGELALEKLNDDALRLRSWQEAYWVSPLDVGDKEAKGIINAVDSNVHCVFTKLKQRVSQDVMEGWEFTYAVITAMDGMRRKGVDMILASEQAAEDRRSSLKEMLNPYSNKIEAAKALAEAARIGDTGMAKDITNLVRRYPTNTRILGVMGAAHARVANYLPSELGEVGVSFFNGDGYSPIVQTIFDLQDGKLTDD